MSKEEPQVNIIPVDDCQHNELTFVNGISEQTITCSVCAKKIALPLVTLISSSRADLVNLVLINFGAKWADWFQRTQFPYFE